MPCQVIAQCTMSCSETRGSHASTWAKTSTSTSTTTMNLSTHSLYASVQARRMWVRRGVGQKEVHEKAAFIWREQAVDVFTFFMSADTHTHNSFFSLGVLFSAGLSHAIAANSL